MTVYSAGKETVALCVNGEVDVKELTDMVMAKADLVIPDAEALARSYVMQNLEVMLNQIGWRSDKKYHFVDVEKCTDKEVLNSLLKKLSMEEDALQRQRNRIGERRKQIEGQLLMIFDASNNHVGYGT